MSNGSVDHNAIQQIATDLWSQKYHSLIDFQDAEISWHHFNKFALETLVAAGATFGPGPKERGEKPKFTNKKICPGQDQAGTA